MILIVLFFIIQIIHSFNLCQIQNQNFRNILTNNYKNIFASTNGGLISSKNENTVWNNWNGCPFRDEMYKITGSSGFTECLLGKSIIVKSIQTYYLNTLIFRLYDLNSRTYNFIVYALLDNIETKIYETTNSASFVKIQFTDQFVNGFKFYNRQGSTQNTIFHNLKTVAFYKYKL